VSFTHALPIILRHEGGYVNDPDDRGGATNKGITQAVYDTYRERIDKPIQPVKQITDEEVSAIYEKNYWLDGLCDRLPYPLAMVHFDFAVNAGITQAFRTLQRVIGTEVDGKFGPRSFEALGRAIRDRGVAALADAYSDERVAFYITITERRPVNVKFLMGWYRRTIATRNFARTLK
jgi:lysozyme family protein